MIGWCPTFAVQPMPTSATVGENVGKSVGAAVGDSVGASVGAIVVGAVGDIVVVGDAVGETVAGSVAVGADVSGWSASMIQMASPSNPQPLHPSASRTVVSHIRKGAAP